MRKVLNEHKEKHNHKQMLVIGSIFITLAFFIYLFVIGIRYIYSYLHRETFDDDNQDEVKTGLRTELKKQHIVFADVADASVQKRLAEDTRLRGMFSLTSRLVLVLYGHSSDGGGAHTGVLEQIKTKMPIYCLYDIGPAVKTLDDAVRFAMLSLVPLHSSKYHLWTDALPESMLQVRKVDDNGDEFANSKLELQT